MTFEELPEFKKDLKALLRKYRSLTDDLETVKLVLSTFPDERPPFSYRIDNLGISTCAIKVRKIACKSLKGRGANSGLRLIYVYDKENDKIIFVEIYHKSEKQREDKDRIKAYFR